MRNRIILLFFTVLYLCSQAQIKLEKLEVQEKMKFEFGSSDILVVDELIMMDSSQIILSPSHAESFIHAKSIIIGNGCRILGQGNDGKSGTPGKNGADMGGPCQDGIIGGDGGGGTNGTHGKNLSLYFTTIKIQGTLLIDLSGGNGGDGGKGGDGGTGGNGTNFCAGGNGGSGGRGGRGGNGGHSGSLKIYSQDLNEVRSKMNFEIKIRLYGGSQGAGGDGGRGGAPGLNSLKFDKVRANGGGKGFEGKSGIQGRISTVFMSEQ